MAKFLIYLFSALMCVTMLNSCGESSDVQDDGKITVNFSAFSAETRTAGDVKIEGMKAVFTDIRNSESTECELNAEGKGTVRLYKGVYNVAIEEKTTNAAGEEIVVSLRLENISVSEQGQKLEGKYYNIPTSALGTNFIFSEIFFNGETNSGQMMHPDQYIVIFNPTSETLYADGLSITSSAQLSAQQPSSWFNTFSPNRVPIRGFVTVPGSGKDHPVAPGERLVIALTAIDHSKTEGYNNAVDLSGADFEVYDGPDSKDVDNPDVPNMIITAGSGGTTGLLFHPRGYVVPLMFKLENGEKDTIEKFLAEHSEDYTQTTEEGEKTTTFVYVPATDIIDGVVTSDAYFTIVTRPLPETVDRGEFIVSGCHRQELAIRKKIQVADRTFYQDTNNSSADFEMVKGQNAFPKGWRNK